MQAIDGVLGNRWPRGFYRAYAETAAIAPAANAIMAAFRFADIKNFATILRVWLTVNVATAVTAQRTDPMRLFFARAYTVRDSTNATAVAISAAMQKMRTGELDSLLATAAGGNFDVANAAAGLTGGTKTVDTNPMGAKGFSQQALAALGTGMEGDIYVGAPQGSHPFVLLPPVPGSGEGLLVQWGATALATGTVTVGVGVEWAESTIA
jgi:hypothetical protein